MKLRKGDKVLVISGKHKGEVGKILKLIKDKAVVQGLNKVKKHVKSPNPDQKKPTIVQIEKPIHISNLMIIDPIDNKPTRIGFQFVTNEGKKVKIRISKRTKQELKIEKQ